MQNDGGESFLKWVLILPVTAITYVFLMVIGKLAVDRILIAPLIKHHRETAFILSHLYTDVFCLALAVMGGITLAPARKMAVAKLFFILSLLTTIKWIVPIFQGNHSFNAYFVASTHFAGGLLPLLITLVNASIVSHNDL
jgi:hypothetical protein